jgi:hypothetical protein
MGSRITSRLMLSTLFVSGAWAWSMPIKSEMLKPRAYFQEADNDLLEALDLKKKTLTFTKKENDTCGAGLVRQAQTLTYSCTLPVPTKSRISKVQSGTGSVNMIVPFGSSKREVQIRVAGDGRSVTYTTTFDKTGVDFEISKFNDDFYAVYAKVAHTVITDAMKKPLVFEILESR